MAIVTAYSMLSGDQAGGYEVFGGNLYSLTLKPSRFLPPGHAVEATSNLYVVEAPWNPITVSLNRFTGADFTYDALNKLTGGMVTGWERAVADQEQFSIIGLSVPATTFASWIENGEIDIAPIVLGGDDSITGTSESDTLWGGAGNDTIDGGGSPSDVASGGDYLRGGEGADVIRGGAGAEDINGNQGNDTVHGGAGDDWVVGGKDDDLLYGDEGVDIVYGNLGNDTCDGDGGNDLIRGGQGDDSLSGGAGDDWLSGDRGDDTLSGGAGADVFHSFGAAGLDRVTDFNLAEGDRVQLDPGTTYTVSQSGADVVIDMAGGGQMLLVGVSMASLTGAWIFAA